MTKKVNILIVDDSATVRDYILSVLSETKEDSAEFFQAGDGSRALEILEVQPIDLVLCDIEMPQMNGFAFLEKMKSKLELVDVPVIMLSGDESVESKVKGLDAGASDYLTKPFDQSELMARVNVQLKVKHLQDELKKANHRYRELSVTDHLTGINNRRYFITLLDQEFERAKRHAHHLTFVILDIDHFKEVNDTAGHLQGDSVISELSHLVRDNVRSHDIVARYGGEEFVLLLPMTSQKHGVRVAKKIHKIIEDQSFKGMNGKPVTVSIGLCTYPCDCISKVDDLIARADESLYVAKDSGRNRVVPHDCTRKRKRAPGDE